MIDEQTIYIGKLPGRKRTALFVYDDGVVWPLAYFVSDDATARFKKIAVDHTALLGEDQ